MAHKCTKLFVFTLMLMYLPTVVAAKETPPAEILDITNNSFIFVFSSNTPDNEIPALAQQLVDNYGGKLRHVYTKALKGFSAKISAEAASLLASQNPEIVRYGRNGSVRVKSSKQGAAGANASGKVPRPATPDPQWGLNRVGGSGDGTGKHAWILDTGIDLDNPDLIVSEDTGINCVQWSIETKDDTAGHGTSIAGIIAGLGEVTNVVGVASGATVYPAGKSTA